MEKKLTVKLTESQVYLVRKIFMNNVALSDSTYEVYEALTKVLDNARSMKVSA